jgi:hypothetical protein
MMLSMASRSLVAFWSTVGADEMFCRDSDGGPRGGNDGEKVFGDGFEEFVPV